MTKSHRVVKITVRKNNGVRFKLHSYSRFIELVSIFLVGVLTRARFLE